MSRVQIVVADPNGVTRELLHELFRSELGALVAVLPNTSELAPFLLETVPDLVVVEIGKDRVAEIALLAQIRQANRNVPFVVLTAWDLPTDRTELERATGADAIISKPFRIDEVLAVVRRLLTRRAEEAEVEELSAP